MLKISQVVLTHYRCFLTILISVIKLIFRWGGWELLKLFRAYTIRNYIEHRIIWHDSVMYKQIYVCIGTSLLDVLIAKTYRTSNNHIVISGIEL